jgi:hypothetical protein
MFSTMKNSPINKGRNSLNASQEKLSLKERLLSDNL